MNLSPITVEARWRLSRIGIALFTHAIISSAGAFLLSALLLLISPAFAGTMLAAWLLSIVPMYLFGFPVFWLILRDIPRERPTAMRLRLRDFFIFFLISYALMQATSLIGTFINTVTDLIFGSSSSADAILLIEQSPIALILLFTVIVAPIFEEIMFRRMIISRLFVFGEKFSILVSASLFALYHGNLSQLFYAFAVGLVLGFVYAKTGKLHYSILLHMLFNLVGAGIPALITQISANDPESFLSLILTVAYIVMTVALILLGLICIYAYGRRISFSPARAPIPATERAQVIVSVGGVLVIILSLAQLLLSYL